ncbi:hypothetical protein KA005_51265 [bacterium]|nr:hypothetical protein [bacterium]
MEVKESELIQIKKTKSVEIYFDEEYKEVILTMFGQEEIDMGSGEVFGSVTIPISKVFQVKRGLESAIQRFYRKKKRS